MSKFRYCIVSAYGDGALGTNDKDVATKYSMSEDFIVIDMESRQLIESGAANNLQELLEKQVSEPDTGDIDKQ